MVLSGPAGTAVLAGIGGRQVAVAAGTAGTGGRQIDVAAGTGGTAGTCPQEVQTGTVSAWVLQVERREDQQTRRSRWR